MLLRQQNKIDALPGFDSIPFGHPVQFPGLPLVDPNMLVNDPNLLALLNATTVAKKDMQAQQAQALGPLGFIQPPSGDPKQFDPFEIIRLNN
jgi:hypothetical protein